MPIIAKYSGMRLAEISQICRKDIRKEHGILCFDICHDTKTQSSKRMVPISDKLKPYVESLLRETRSEKLFENCGDLVRDNITMKHANDARMLAAVETLAKVTSVPGAGGHSVQVSEEHVIRADVLATKHGLNSRQAKTYLLEHEKFQVEEFEKLCPGVNRRTL